MVICFDHRRSTLPKIYGGSIRFHLDVEKSSSRAMYEYFSPKFGYMASSDKNVGANSLLNSNDQQRMDSVLNYLEDGDLRTWRLPDVQAFKVGISEWRSKLNCVTNPFMYEQLLQLSAENLIAKGKSNITNQKDSVKEFLDKAFKLRLGQGFYGECLGVRADSNPDLSDEIGKELSIRSAAAGLRPIGAVIFMQRRNLKMCLRSADGAADASEIAKAYGGGGSPSSSSFIIRMDEYNQWL